jgi:CRP-like cAMP-binding protein
MPEALRPTVEGDFLDTVCTVLCPTLTRPQAGALLAASEPLGVHAGEVVFHEGQPGTGLLFFVSGQVEILKRRPDGSQQPLALVNAPSMLGEVSLVTEGPHSATVRATRTCEFRFLSKEQLRRRLAADDLAAHRLVGAIALVLAHRLLRLSEEVLQLGTGLERGLPVEELARARQRLLSEWTV